MSADPEVLVVGAGPAGLVAARALALRGHRVLAVDRGRPGRDKACGEGLMPDAVRSLRRLGIDAARAGVPFHGIRYFDGSVQATGTFPGEPGLGVRRTAFHRLLADAARDAGVEIAWETRVSDFDGERVITTRGPLRARWLVAADGLHSDLRRWAGLAARAGRPLRYGVRRHYALPPWGDRVEVHWARGAEAYVTPVAPDRVGVAMLWRGDTACFDDLLRRFPRLVARLDGVPAASRDRGAGHFRQIVHRVVRGRLALLGDASGYLDPITGEGMGLAFRQAEALADAVDRGDLERYAADHRRLARRAWVLTRILLALEPRPLLRRQAFRLLGAVPGLFAALLGWMTADGG